LSSFLQSVLVCIGEKKQSTQTGVSSKIYDENKFLCKVQN